MIRMEGLFSESFGGTCTIRGYARYDEIVELSYPHPGYQRPVDDVHVGEISMFITSGSNSFSPEVVLAYTAKYDYYKEGAVSGIDAIADIRNGNGFTSNIDGISFKKIRKVNNGYLYEISIPYEKKLIDEEKPFRRVDGNHRLQAMEQLVSTGQISSTYLIPFCLILFADTDSLKDEKVIFHNINSKAVPLKSEQLLKSVLIQQHDGLDFNDRELIEKFGPEYLLARKILSANPLTVRKLGYIEWIHPRILSTLVDLINYVQEKSGTRIETLEQQETSVYKGYKQDKIEMRGDRAEMSDFPLYLNTVSGGLDCRNQAIGGFSFVVKIYALPVVEIIGQFLYLLGRYGFDAQIGYCF